MPKATDRFQTLDVFRGLAAMIVVVYHYFYRYEQLYGHEGIPVDWTRLGLYGVHFFFLISGFVIYWSLQRAPSVSSFLVSRFSRIFPAYWVALILTFSLVALFGLPGREFEFVTLVINFSMIQEYLNVPHIDQAYWTLTTELTFYFWIAVLLATGRLKHAEYWLLPFMAIGAAHYLGFIELPLRVSKSLLIKHANLFMAGILLYRLYTATHKWDIWPLLVVSAAMNFLIYTKVWYDPWFLASYYVAFALAVTGRLNKLCVRPLLWLGSISYTLYLLHQNIGYVIIREVYAMGGNGWVAIGVALVMVLMMAECLSRLVERPAAASLRSLKKRFDAGRSQKPDDRPEEIENLASTRRR